MNITTPKATALATFEARRDAILKDARKLPSLIDAYDRAISCAGDHANWEHSGTMQMVEEKLADVVRILAECAAATKSPAQRAANSERFKAMQRRQMLTK